MKPSIRRCLAVLALTGLTATVAPAQSFFYQPGPTGTRDTWTFDLEDFDHGTWGTLQANEAQYNQRIFLQFPNLSGITGPVQSAVVGLYRFGTGSADPITLDAHAVTQSWTDDITWSTMPTSATEVAGSATMTGTSAGWVEWDITALVNSWLNGTRSNFGVAIYDHGSGVYQRFASSDNATATQPISVTFPTDVQYQPYLRGELVPEPATAALLGLGLAAMVMAQPRARGTRK